MPSTSSGRNPAVATSVASVATPAPCWKMLQKVEATKNSRGTIAVKLSAAIRIEESYESTTIFGTVLVEEWTGQQKQFRIRYDGINNRGDPHAGTLLLPATNWILNTVKAISDNARARLLLMQFPVQVDNVSEIQITLPIANHSDSKVSKVFVESFTLYAKHHIRGVVVKLHKQK